jgi:hypothetical protein
MNHEIYTLWAAVIATLGVYTILYRENPISRLFEHIFVGLSAGYMLLLVWTLNLLPKWWKPMIGERRWYWVFAALVGFLFYFIYSRRLVWLARLVIGLFLGAASGTFFREFFPLLSPQIAASFKSLRPQEAVSLASTVSTHWLALLILLTVMSYFFFSVPYEGGFGRGLGRVSSLGRWFLMIAFGAMFGNTVMARMSLFIGRVYFLLNDWLGHYIPWFARSGI